MEPETFDQYVHEGLAMARISDKMQAKLKGVRITLDPMRYYLLSKLADKLGMSRTGAADYILEGAIVYAAQVAEIPMPSGDDLSAWLKHGVDSGE